MIAPNRPGLAEIAYRVGTHATFKAAMLAALSSGRWPALAGLVTREDDDFTIALLDSWAVVSDILTFYGERLANESYLQTATEIESVAAILALVDYALHPGVAAHTDLAFSLQAAGAVGPSDTVTLAAGAQVKSLPGPGQLPQTFETSLSLDAVPELNALPLLARRPQTVPSGTTQSIVLSGPAARLQKGDVLVIVPPAAGPLYAEVVQAVVDPTAGLTTVALTNVQPLAGAAKPGAAAPSASAARKTVSARDIYSRASFLAAPPGDAVREVLAQTFLPPATQTPQAVTQVYALRTPAHLFAYNAPDFRSMPESVKKAYSESRAADWPFTYTAKSAAAQSLEISEAAPVAAPAPETPPAAPAAPSKLKSLLGPLLAFTAARGAPAAARGTSAQTEARRSEPTETEATPLDRVYTVFPNDWVAIKWPDGGVYFSPVDAARNASFNAFGLSGPATLLEFRQAGRSLPTSVEEVRGALVYLQSETLQFAAAVPLSATELSAPIDIGALDLDGRFALVPKRRVVISGTTPDPVSGGVRKVVAAGTISTSSFTNIFSTPTVRIGVTLDAAFDTPPTIGSTTLFANVVAATHGESVDEVLGSGDATTTSQTFSLSHTPLTYLSSPESPGGIASTLVIEVNGIAWQEVDSLVTAGPRDRVFVTRSGPGGGTTIRFGDGTHGARLPTGYENVHAYYRFGSGSEGTIDSGQLTLPITRPLSLRAVTNPSATTGGVDPEDRVSAQRSGPAFARTADRIVTLADFADFARTAGGVSDARADLVRGAAFPSIVVTIASATGLGGDDGVRAGLQTLLHANASTTFAIRVAWATPLVVQLAATLAVEAPFRQQGPAQANLLSSVAAAVNATFAFPNHALGAPLYRSEVAAAMQSVSGVIAVVSLKWQTPVDAGVPPVNELPERIAAPGASIGPKGEAVGATSIGIDGPTLVVTVLP